MTVEVDVFQTRAFAASPHGGNPCPVVPFPEGLTDDDMLKLARRFGQDTAFIVAARSNRADIGIRYFVPNHEMGVSGHATIAALTVAIDLAIISRRNIRVETASGIFEARWELRTENRPIVTLEQSAPTFGVEPRPEDVVKTLGIDYDAIDTSSPIQSVSVSRAKLLVPITDSKILDAVKLDFVAVWEALRGIRGHRILCVHAPGRSEQGRRRRTSISTQGRISGRRCDWRGSRRPCGALGSLRFGLQTRRKRVPSWAGIRHGFSEQDRGRSDLLGPQSCRHCNQRIMLRYQQRDGDCPVRWYEVGPGYAHAPAK